MDSVEIAAITNVVNLYPVAVDTQSWELLDHVFTPDCYVDFGAPAVWTERASLKLAFDMIHAPFAATQHATRGHHVAVDGERATCLSYVLGRFIRDVPGGNMFESAGWYDDELVRTTVFGIAEELGQDGLILRYKVHETDDGLEGEEGTLAICTWWLVSALVEIGELSYVDQYAFVVKAREKRAAQAAAEQGEGTGAPQAPEAP